MVASRFTCHLLTRGSSVCTFLLHSGRKEKVVRGSSLLCAAPALILQLCSPSEVMISVPRMEEIPRGVIFLSGRMNKLPAPVLARGSPVSLVIRLMPVL